MIQLAIWGLSGVILGGTAALPAWRGLRLPLVLFVVLAWSLVGEPVALAPQVAQWFWPPERFY